MKKTIVFLTLLAALAGFAHSQPPRPIVFAVLHDGRTIEPIAFIENGKLVDAVDGGSESSVLAAFNSMYFKPKTTYQLIFGGADAGTVAVKGEPDGECSPNMPDVVVTSPRAKLRGMVMALATNHSVGKTTPFRRVPTASERTAVERSVRAEFAKKKLAGKPLRSQNLTALDVDGDGRVELVGSYWVNRSEKARALIFFIADKDAKGTFRFGHSEFNSFDENDVMSGDIKTLDEGVYHEVLLDVFDIDGDGIAEVFTYTPGFEGAGFDVYSRKKGKWSRIYEGANYHCGY